MSSLYNKYEPDTLDKVLSNENNKTIIKGFLNQKEIPQSYIFYGSHGNGKTLFSNLMAKELNCKNNIYELNASNDRGIEAIRQIIDSCQYKSIDGNNKAYILDECHQLPTLSQEALLTTLQKPPKNVYFFFCTTELNKIIPTIRSRCKQIEVEKIDIRTLYPYLIEISEKENNIISKLVARKIVDSTDCHIRDSLNLLESVLQFKEEDKQLEIIKNGLEEEKEIIDLCRILYKNSNWSEVSNILKSLQKKKNEVETFRRVILAYFGKILLYNPSNKVALIIDLMRNPYNSFEVFCCDIYSIFLEK